MKVIKKHFALLCALAFCAAFLASPQAARAAELEVVKTAGVPLAVGAYDEGGTLVITGAALELGEDEDDLGDWQVLADLRNSFKLRFENGQAEIPEAALSDALLLEIEGPDVVEIGGWAFAYTPLEKAVFPNVERMSGNPFIVMNKLYADGLQLNAEAFAVDRDKGVLYDKGRTRIVAHLFSNNEAAFTAPASVTAVADYAFAATKLKEATLPNVRTLGTGAFSGSSLKTFSMPNAAEIGAHAFLQNAGLTVVHLPKAETLGYQAFAACQNLAAVSLPNVKTLGEGAFFNDSRLAALAMPKAEAIGKGAFANLNTRTAIVLEFGASVPAISDDAFSANDAKEFLLLTPNPENWGTAAAAYFPQGTSLLRANITHGPVELFDGDRLELTAEIDGTTAPYQWTLDAVALAGATGTSYVQEAANASDIGLYAMQFAYNGKTYAIAPIGVRFVTPELRVFPASRTLKAAAQADESFTLGAFFGDREFAVTGFELSSNLDRAGLILDKAAAGAGFRVHGIPSVTGDYKVDVAAQVQGYAETFTASAAITVDESDGGGTLPGQPCYGGGSSGCTAVGAGLAALLVLLPLVVIRARTRR